MGVIKWHTTEGEGLIIGLIGLLAGLIGVGGNLTYNPIWNNWDSYSDPEFLFNTFVRSAPIYNDYPLMRWNDYASVQKWSTAPYIGKYFKTRMTELENAENERYWNDKARNMGFSLDDLNYPIRSGLYGRPVGSGDYFEATQSVIGLYDDLRKW